MSSGYSAGRPAGSYRSYHWWSQASPKTPPSQPTSLHIDSMATFTWWWPSSNLQTAGLQQEARSERALASLLTRSESAMTAAKQLHGRCPDASRANVAAWHTGLCEGMCKYVQGLPLPRSSKVSTTMNDSSHLQKST